MNRLLAASAPRRWLGAIVFALVVLASAVAQIPANADSARIMRLDHFVLPEFPEFLRRTGVLQGTVVAAISHDGLGRADDILILESTEPRFTAAVLEAVREWRFAAHPRSPAPIEALVPVVRFLFSSTSVSVVSTTVDAGRAGHTRVRADSPIELPNFTHLDKVPQARVEAEPDFPAELIGRVSEGIALVKFFVDADGRARVPVALTASDPAFATAAVAAAKQWRFDPPRLDGKPVIALETRTIRFRGAAR
jgi:TonB family protein